MVQNEGAIFQSILATLNFYKGSAPTSMQLQNNSVLTSFFWLEKGTICSYFDRKKKQLVFFLFRKLMINIFFIPKVEKNIESKNFCNRGQGAYHCNCIHTF